MVMNKYIYIIIFFVIIVKKINLDDSLNFFLYEFFVEFIFDICYCVIGYLYVFVCGKFNRLL